MGLLKAQYDSMDEVPEAFRELYKDTDGKALLAEVDGVFFPADKAKLEEALRKERNDHRAVRDKLKVWDGLAPEEVRAKLDEYEPLKLLAEGKNDGKLAEMVQARLNQTLAPVQRERDTFKSELERAQVRISEMSQKETRRVIRDKVQEALVSGKVEPDAYEDALLLAERHFEVTDDGQVITRDGLGSITAGTQPKDWLAEMLLKRKHWLPPSQGSGATGAKGSGATGINPWSAKNFSVTEQARYLNEHGEEKARQRCAAAGATWGAGKPPA